MKRMSDVFELPVSDVELEIYGCFYKEGCEIADGEKAAARAINNVDKLADALDESLAMLFMAHHLHYGAGINDLAIAKLRAVLDDYRGEL